MATAAVLGACSGPAPGNGDAGDAVVTDSGCLGCAIPDAGRSCEALFVGCTDGGLCCPGLTCDGARCEPAQDPCPNGEQPLANGCGCDPTLDAGCDPGLSCGPDLHCHPPGDGGAAPRFDQPLGAPCDPGALGPDGGPAAPCAPLDGSVPVDCVADPSGQALYVCEQACSADRDCPLAWQSCGAAYAAAGHCGDTPCTGFPATPAEQENDYFSPCRLVGAEPGLCTPFPVWVEGTPRPVDHGLCIEDDPDAGLGDPCGWPPVRGSLCGPRELCALSRCRAPCNAALQGGGGSESCPATQVCVAVAPFAPAGAVYLAGGCVDGCELDGGCDAGQPGLPDAGLDGGEPSDAGPTDSGVILDAGSEDGGAGERFADAGGSDAGGNGGGDGG